MTLQWVDDRIEDKDYYVLTPSYTNTYPSFCIQGVFLRTRFSAGSISPGLQAEASTSGQGSMQ